MLSNWAQLYFTGIAAMKQGQYEEIGEKYIFYENTTHRHFSTFSKLADIRCKKCLFSSYFLGLFPSHVLFSH
jgi:hypothetical protein